VKFIYYLLALLSGTFLTLQVGVNGRLRAGLGSPVLASLISFTVGSLGLAVTYAAAALLGAQEAFPVQGIRHTQWWMWLGGLLGAFYVWVSILASPKIGFGNLFSLVISGQIILALVFDQFGFLGIPLHPVSPLRAVGAVLLIIGVYLVQSY
jgi:transporter family-2 protein